MKYYVNLGVASCAIIGAVLALGLVLEPVVYASKSSGNSETNLGQDLDQDQKCKIGDFDDEDGSSSTVAGLCNQQAQNNIDSGGSIDGDGISNW